MAYLSPEQHALLHDLLSDKTLYINGAPIPDDLKKAAWANWRVLNWCVFDFETTGLLVDNDGKLQREFGATQFAGQLYSNRILVDETDFYIFPDAEISEESERITGITMDDVGDAPSFHEHLAKGAFEMLGQADLWIAYNARFDIQCLMFELVAMGWDRSSIVDFCNVPFLDLVVFEIDRSNKFSGNGLAKVCSRFGVKIKSDEMHAATADVTALADLVMVYMDQLPYTLLQLVGRQADLMARQDLYLTKKYGPRLAPLVAKQEDQTTLNFGE